MHIRKFGQHLTQTDFTSCIWPIIAKVSTMVISTRKVIYQRVLSTGRVQLDLCTWPKQSVWHQFQTIFLHFNYNSKILNKQAWKGFRPPQVRWRELDTFKILEIFWEFWGDFLDFFGNFWGGFFLEEFFWRIFGGFFQENSLGGIT